MLWLERATKWMMLGVGCAGVVVIYSGFFYFLLLTEQDNVIPWYTLLTPWICIFFGLNKKQQVYVLHWFSKKR